MATDGNIRELISELVKQEKELRERLGRGEISREEEQGLLRSIETELDQCWDLLRRRDAAREFGGDPGETQVRPASTVENYRG